MIGMAAIVHEVGDLAHRRRLRHDRRSQEGSA